MFWGAEPHSSPEYPSDGDKEAFTTRCTSNTNPDTDTTKTPSSSSASGDTIVLSAKSLLISISDDSDELQQREFVEVLVLSEALDDDSDFESLPSKKGGKRSTSHSSRSMNPTR